MKYETFNNEKTANANFNTKKKKKILHVTVYISFVYRLQPLILLLFTYTHHGPI